MMKSRRGCLSVLTVAVLFEFGIAPVLRAEQPLGPPADRLDVRTCGASGSDFSTKASTTKGSKTITVADVGDFKVGQGVMLSESNPRITKQTIWGPRHVVVMGRPLKGKAEIQGYDGSQGDWLVLLLDVPEGTTSFRWSEDIARSWSPTVPITGEWQPLRDGIKVRFGKHDWEKGYTVAFTARGQLVTVIEKIEGQVVTLRDAPKRTVSSAVLRHCDDAALQAAINQALKQKRNVHVPVGRYRLSRGLRVQSAESITIEGASAENTVFDISGGEGACITLSRGTEVTIRNLTMVGHSGFKERDQCGLLRTRGSSYFWGFGAKGCNAVTIGGTKRVLIENCHGRRMATECFVSGCRSRGKPGKPNAHYSQSTTYLRCSAIDCGRNAFNDVTCGPENTSVLYCRIVDVGGCAWEGASRFVKFVGNYVRNAGTVAMGNLGTYNRDESYPALGAGQHIVSNNVFESNVPYGGCAIRTAVGATQVLVANNLFVNFGSSAVHASGRSDPTHYPSARTTITGNIFDMTEIGETSRPRTAVDVSASGAIVSNNQIYVRGPCDPKVTAIKLLEPAVDVTIHDNLIRNCGTGIVTGRAVSRVAEVIDPSTFATRYRTLPLDPLTEQQCQGWQVVWLAGRRPTGTSVIEAVTGAAEPKTLRFKLKEPRQLKSGSSFELIPPAANWNIHDNTIADCLNPVILDSYGGATSLLRGNTLTLSATSGVKQAIRLHGRFCLIGNHLSGFDETGCAALALHPDPLGRAVQGLFHGNIFERCAQIVQESRAGLWQASSVRDNVFIECSSVPEQAGPAAARDKVVPVVTEAIALKAPVLTAPRTPKPPKLDGSAEEWPWAQNDRVVTIAQTPTGSPFGTPAGRACAAWDNQHLYLAIRIAIPKGAKLRGGTDFRTCDGVEVSLQAPSAKATTPIFVLWGSTDGSYQALPPGGATPAQCQALQKGVAYAARVTPKEWTCQWRIPFAALEVDPLKVDRLRFNIGTHLAASDAWIAWVATGGAFYEVGSAGELVLVK